MRRRARPLAAVLLLGGLGAGVAWMARGGDDGPGAGPAVEAPGRPGPSPAGRLPGPPTPGTPAPSGGPDAPGTAGGPDDATAPPRGDRVVAGRVLDRDGAGVAGATVTARYVGPAAPGAPELRGVSAAADAEGRFTVAGLGEGTWAVHAEAAGHVPGGTVRVAAGAVDVELRISRRGWVEGVARRPDDGPLPTIRLTAADGAGETTTVTPAPDGTYRSGPLATGRYRVTVDDPAGSGLVPEAAPEVIVMEGGPARLDVTLRPGVTLGGRVRAADGRPLGPVTVHAVLAGPAQDAGAESGRTAADGDGAYALKGLAAGAWRVVAVAEGCAPREEDAGSLAAGAGATVDVVLERWAAVRVRVEDPRGRPVAGAVVVLDRNGLPARVEGDDPVAGTEARRRQRRVTAADGTVVLRVEPGRVTVLARHEPSFAVAEGVAVDAAPGATADATLVVRARERPSDR